MQDIRAGGRDRDRVAAYLEACGVDLVAAADPALRSRVEDLLNFYGSDVTGEHTPPVRPFVLSKGDPDYVEFLSGDVEEREQILERRIIQRFTALLQLG